jgi:hypothetical protein
VLPLDTCAHNKRCIACQDKNQHVWLYIQRALYVVDYCGNGSRRLIFPGGRRGQSLMRAAVFDSSDSPTPVV